MSIQELFSTLLNNCEGANKRGIDRAQIIGTLELVKGTYIAMSVKLGAQSQRPPGESRPPLIVLPNGAISAAPDPACVVCGEPVPIGRGICQRCQSNPQG